MTSDTDDLVSVAAVVEMLRPLSTGAADSQLKYVYQLMGNELVDMRAGETVPIGEPRITRESVVAYVDKRRERERRRHGGNSKPPNGDPSRDGVNSVQILTTRLHLLAAQQRTDSDVALRRLELEIEEHRRTAQERDDARRALEFDKKILEARIAEMTKLANSERAIRIDLEDTIHQETGPQAAT
jgi:hypothetical protein